MKQLGDFTPGETIYGEFNTIQPSTAAPFTLAGTPSLTVYKDDGTTQDASGVSLTVDFDSVTGLHVFEIDTAQDEAFYATGSQFRVVIAAGTVDSVSVVGHVVARFTLGLSAFTAADRVMLAAIYERFGDSEVGLPTYVGGTEYISSGDVQNRLTAAGLVYLADENNSGGVSSEELEANITTSVVYAGQIVDGYICDQIVPSTARAAGNVWLCDRALDIAAYRSAGVGGREIPEAFTTAYEQTIKLLEGVKDGNRVPGYVYPVPQNADRVQRKPRTVNIWRPRG